MTPLEALVWAGALIFWGLLGVFVAVYLFVTWRRRWTWTWRRG